MPPALLGRRDEQRALDALVAGARLGSSGVLVITGEPGIGKSVLLDEAAERAHGFTLLRVTGTEAERDLPYAGLAHLLRPLEERLALLPAPQARALEVALALREGADADRFAVSAAVLGLVTSAGEDRPVGIVLDDAHLLDRPSAEALAFLARRLLADAVFVLVAQRPGETPTWDDAGLPRLELVRLDEESSRRLVAEAADGPLTGGQVEQVAALARGNPMALRALARDPDSAQPVEGGLGAMPGAMAAAIPSVVADAFGRRASRLDPGDLRVVQAAAVAGPDLGVVARVCQVDGLDLAALERAETLGIVHLGSGIVDFAHPLARSAVYAGAPPATRRRLHALAADACPPGDRDRRAWHLSAAALGPDDAAADALADVAARAVQRGAHAVAASALERAAQLSTSPRQRGRRYLAAADAAWYAGEDARVATLVTQAVRHDPSEGVRARADALTGMVSARSGSLEDARDLLVDAARASEPQDPGAALELYAEAVQTCFFLLDTGSAQRAADRLEELLARPLQVADRSAAMASIAVGMARIGAGQPGDGQIRAGVATLAGRGRSDGERTTLWEVLGLLYLRDAAASRAAILDAVQRSRDAAALGSLPDLLFNLARDDATSDRWSRAEAEYGEGLTLARELGQSTQLGILLAGSTWLLGRLGRVDDCRASAAEALALASTRRMHVVTAWVEFALAELDLCGGAVTEAAERFARLDASLRRQGALDPDLSPVPELVEAHLRLGDRAEAERLATDYVERATYKGQPWSRARAARVQAMLAPDDEVDDRFGAALTWHARTPDGFETARTRLVYGARLRRLRRRTDAREPLRAALASFARLGATGWAEAASIELSATGLTAHRRETGPVDELTPRELQVGLLLAEGRTTREAAAALFLSPKTVEYHLRHLYTKLGISSRPQLAEALRDRRG